VINGAVGVVGVGVGAGVGGVGVGGVGAAFEVAVTIDEPLT